MNFLQICQSAVMECGVAGTITTTAGQIGSAGRIVSWCSSAWNELQAMRSDWNWMRSSSLLGGGVTVTPVPGQYNMQLGTGALQIGVATDSFGSWDERAFRCFTTPAPGAGGAIGTGAIGSLAIGVVPGSGAVPGDELPLPCIDFDSWRDRYMMGSMRNVKTRPTVVAIGPDQSLNFGPPSNGNYSIAADFFVAPSVMANDADVPIGLPLRFHMVIVYKAMLKYGGYESAADVIERAESEWGSLYRALLAARLPRMNFAGALA